MVWMRAAWAAVLMCGFAHVHAAPNGAAGSTVAAVDSREAKAYVEDVVATRDNKGLPFAVVDKRGARLYLFDARGRLQAATPVLIGQAPGDFIAKNVGEHAQEGNVPFEERTTPAGRFIAQGGVNAEGEHVLWLDWNAAFAIHRLRPGKAWKDRVARLASPNAADKRASWGCVIVPVAFYQRELQRWIGQRNAGKGVVYVMAETPEGLTASRGQPAAGAGGQ